MIPIYTVYRSKRFRWWVDGPIPNQPMAIAEFGPYRSRRKAFKVALSAARVFNETNGVEE